MWPMWRRKINLFQRAYRMSWNGNAMAAQEGPGRHKSILFGESADNG